MTSDLTLSSVKTVFNSPWFSLEQISVRKNRLSENHTDDSDPYYRLVERQGVICILLSPDGEFIMVKQPRPAIGCYTYEFPAGGIEDKETAEEAVRREVLEEAGLRLSVLQALGVTQPLPNRIDSCQSLFFGISSTSRPEVKTEHDMKTVFVPRHFFLEKLMRDGIHCVVALGGIKLAELRYSIDLFNDPFDSIIQKLESSCDTSNSVRRG